MTVFLGCYTDADHPNGLKALSLDEATGRMEIVAEYPVSNALYQALSPNGKWLYSCSGEGLAAFDVSRRDAETQRKTNSDSSDMSANALSLKTRALASASEKSEFISTPLRENYSIAAAIRFTPDGKGVVVSNRGENSLVVFDFDEATGRLAFKARTLLTGSWPRDFIFVSPTLALVAMERSGEVHALRFDAASGGFSILSTLSGLFRPMALARRRCA